MNLSSPYTSGFSIPQLLLTTELDESRAILEAQLLLTHVRIPSSGRLCMVYTHVESFKPSALQPLRKTGEIEGPRHNMRLYYLINVYAWLRHAE
jgi:hypothetical protein